MLGSGEQFQKAQTGDPMPNHPDITAYSPDLERFLELDLYQSIRGGSVDSDVAV